MKWQVRSSNRMLILGIIFIIAGFGLMTFFFKFMPFSPSEKLTMWLSALLIMLVFGLGLFSIIVVKTKEVAATFMVLFVWSLVFLVPVPKGCEDFLWGGSLLLLCATVVCYVKYKESKKKKA
ncbi:MAG: hypothetical protein OEY24_00410 [Candidatus Bathyarchaeota archaeon]|nr:hypothetical protein [Candidatus Bathyarchaeota archaeon]